MFRWILNLVLFCLSFQIFQVLRFDVNEQPAFPLFNNKATNESFTEKNFQNCDSEFNKTEKKQTKSDKKKSFYKDISENVLSIQNNHSLSRNRFGQFYKAQTLMKEVNVECRVAGDEISHHILLIMSQQVYRYTDIQQKIII